MSIARSKVISPTTLPASSLDTNSFILRHPLVEVNIGAVAKFEDGRMLDNAVCRFFLWKVMTEMHKSARCYAGSTYTGELRYRPVACSLLPVFTSLAPRRGELLPGEDSKYLNRDVASGFEYTVADVDQMPDFMSDMSGWSFCDGTFTHEDGANLKPHEAVDVRGYVIDLSLPNHPRLARSIFEMKGFVDWEVVVYQALYYGCAAAMENLAFGRYKKIHVVVMGIPWIGVAEIDPIGWLIADPLNKFTLEGVAIFKTHVDEKCKYLERKGKTTESNALRVKYLNKTDAALLYDLQKQMTSRMSHAATALNARAPVGTVYSPVFDQPARILVGTATIGSNEYYLPKFPLTQGKKAGENAMVVVSGIARIMYGDRALKWRLPQVEALAASREQEVSLLVESCLPPEP